MHDILKVTKECREIFISYGKLFCERVDPRIEKLKKVLDNESLIIKKTQNKVIISMLENFIQDNLVYSGLIKMGYFLILCDSEGYVIKLIHNDHLMDYFKEINLVEGASLRLEDSGTNAINLAMEYKMQVEICGEDHYCELFKNWYCTAMPVMDYNEAAIVAYLNLSCLNYQSINNQSLILKNIVNQIEKQLLFSHENNCMQGRKLNHTDKVILSYLARGYTRKSICALVHKSESSLKRRLYKLYNLFNADNDLTLVLNAIKAGVIDLNGNIL
ncbi:AsnC family protein [Thermosediminibacter litoriperuensis]|uniref:Uncharacterized protein n=1 Tax=Thermosediminibacter litoriperuensis TaxID=291989 RepID=A0A5S5AUQ7_9FIRM|nr:AsnC family protein [Thermosediminibacter litoriperuensis]TYP56194.1 hypothetical protein LZ11_01118 [Thermosediminibacter litoriperuensis]